MPGRELICRIIEKRWLTPTVMGIRFEPSRKFSFEAGQFISLVAPPPAPGEKRRPRRAYSLACGPREGFELCVKHVEGGVGSGFLARLENGDTFKAYAPYGDFYYETPPERRACFVCTGTGIAPLRSMIRSHHFLDNPPEAATLVSGVRDEKEIIYPGEFERLGIEVVDALSRPQTDWKGFRGRVTDYLAGLSPDWGWHLTDFYLCGNGDMVSAVRRLLLARGVPERAIRQEVYFTPSDRVGTKIVAA